MSSIQQPLPSKPENYGVESSAESLGGRMTFARETSGATTPSWQSPTLFRARTALAICNKINDTLSTSANSLTIGVINADGDTLARISALVYFSGLLLSNLHPEDGVLTTQTYARFEKVWDGIEVEVLRLLKGLKGYETQIQNFVGPILAEIDKKAYKQFIGLEYWKSELEDEENFDRQIFKRYPLENASVGVWMEMVNYEKDVVYFQCADIKWKNGGVARILAEAVPLNIGVNICGLLLDEIHDAVRKATLSLDGNQVLNEDEGKKWKKAGQRLIRSMKDNRREYNFGATNCSNQLSTTLNELNWKARVVVENKIRIIRNVGEWILKGIECIKRKSGSWAPCDLVDLTKPSVLKYISPGQVHSKISKAFPCFYSNQDAVQIDFVQMFQDIGNSIGDKFVLDVHVSDAMKNELFTESMLQEDGAGKVSIQELRDEEVASILTTAQSLTSPVITIPDEPVRPITVPTEVEASNMTDYLNDEHIYEDSGEEDERHNPPPILHQPHFDDNTTPGATSEFHRSRHHPNRRELRIQYHQYHQGHHFHHHRHPINGAAAAHQQKANKTFEPDQMNESEQRGGSSGAGTQNSDKIYWPRRLIDRMGKK